ncbi:MAG: hypothetical protein FWD03_04670 [Defluviitaleaceae bacterium]|nr:hypothetical protein [Defluviitaleaceae bacterium]
MIIINALLFLLTVLLWLFLILLLLLILVLIVPISYRVKGQIGQQTDVKVKAGWFFGLFRVLYESKHSTFAVKIAFFTVPERWLSPENFIKKDKSKDEDEDTVGFSMGFSDIKGLFTNLDIKSILSLGILLMKKLFKKIFPRRFIVRGVVGLSDPCATGQFIGFYEAVAHAIGLRHSIDLAGDFNQKVLNLDVNVRGRFAIASLLWPIIWFIFQKPVWDGLKMMKKKERVAA